MTKQLLIGLTGEGVTDYRFLNSIVQRTFEQLAFECVGDVEILAVQNIKIPKQPFADHALQAAKLAHQELGLMILCIHTDADEKNDAEAFQYRITPALTKIQETEGEELCKQIVPIVPVVMSEAWMLADKALFKAEIGTDLSFPNLGITKSPEQIREPKRVIEEAIRIAYSGHKRRRKLPKIAELYLPIGQKADLSQLQKLPSYQKFENAARKILVDMNYLQQ